MTEPATTSTAAVGLLASALVGLLGPDGVEYASIVVAGVAGALWPLSKAATGTRRSAAALVLRLSLTSICLTGLVVWCLQRYLGWTGPTQVASVGVAFLVAAVGDDWTGIFRALTARAKSVISGDKA